MNQPSPGSPEAVKNGCTCPIMDNARGAGVFGNGSEYGWWMNSTCPLHGEEE